MNICSFAIIIIFLKKKIMTDSILYQYRFISEKSLNGHGTLFGGTAMEWMDEGLIKKTGFKPVSTNIKCINLRDNPLL
jgi:hypothetical protein